MNSYSVPPAFARLSLLLFSYMAHNPSHTLSFAFGTGATTHFGQKSTVSPFTTNTNTGGRCVLHHVVLEGSNSKWDNLVDEDDDDEPKGPPIPVDMRYVPRNVIRQNQNYIAIREAGGEEMVNDIYVREPDSSIFWFIGKVARISDVSIEQTVARQWGLVEHHASMLRPKELYPNRGSLEIWAAPGDSEMDVAYNRPTATFVKMEREDVEGAKAVKSSFVGFDGEIYDQAEEGFRAERTEDGRPANPEIKGPDEQSATGDAASAPITEDALEELKKKFGGQDISQIYGQQSMEDEDE